MDTGLLCYGTPSGFLQSGTSESLQCPSDKHAPTNMRPSSPSYTGSLCYARHTGLPYTPWPSFFRTLADIVCLAGYHLARHLAYPQVHHKPSLAASANGARCHPPDSCQCLAGRALRKARYHVQGKQGTSIRVRYAHALRWWSFDWYVADICPVPHAYLSPGFALIYDSREAMNFEPKHRLIRKGLATKVDKASRKLRKERKNRAKSTCHYCCLMGCVAHTPLQSSVVLPRRRVLLPTRRSNGPRLIDSHQECCTPLYHTTHVLFPHFPVALRCKQSCQNGTPLWGIAEYSDLVCTSWVCHRHSSYMKDVPFYVLIDT